MNIHLRGKVGTGIRFKENLAVIFGDSLPQDLVPISLVEMICRSAESSSEGSIYLGSFGQEKFQSYRSLLEEAVKIAGTLSASGLRPGDKVILQFEHPADFLLGFWSCILGGFVPIPIPVSLRRDSEDLPSRRLRYSYAFLDSPFILTTSELLPVVAGMIQSPHTNHGRIHAIQELQAKSNATEVHNSSIEDTAAIILTSGSTGVPKFVALSHLNFFGTIAGSASFQDLNSSDISLNWLPFHHISALMRSLRDVYVGCRQFQGSSSEVLANPLQWIDWIDQYRVTQTWAPNFAFGMLAACNEGWETRQWNLQCVRSIVATGEPVVQKVIEAVGKRLEPFGFRKTALHVSWGMTEACFSVCSVDSIAQPSNEVFAHVGKPIAGVSVRIVNSNDEPVDVGVEGHLQVRGQNVIHSYYGDPDLNSKAFTADGWLRTGDLGVIRGGSLSITGREKDLVMINGVKYSIVEIEALVQEIDGVVAFSVVVCGFLNPKSSTESFAVFFQPSEENDQSLRALIHQIQISIHKKMGITPRYLIPLPASKIPRSSSGKVLRSDLRDLLIAGAYQTDIERVERVTNVSVQSDRHSDSLESRIAAVFCDVLKLQTVGTHESFFDFGGSSVHAIAIASRLTDMIPERMCSPIDIFQHPTVQQLTFYLRGDEANMDDQVSAGINRAELRKLRRFQRRNVRESMA